jgi:large subunit ribosomal protein L18
MAMRIVGRERRRLRIRRKISGTPEKPRLSVFRSAKHIYAQVVDDAAGKTVAHASTLSREVRGEVMAVTSPATPREDREPGRMSKLDAAKKVGQAIAKLLLAKGINKVVFDRNGYLYHGRVRALADAARSAGLKF